MSDVIDSSSTDAPHDSRVSHRHVGHRFLAQPTVHSHAVQFYEDEAFLVETVAIFLAAGLRAGDRLVVIATEAHRNAFLDALGADGRNARSSGQLTMLDAAETLDLFMVDGAPDRARFRNVLGRVFAQVCAGHDGRRIRAYGEMVDLLWRRGNPTAAIRLEELWNEAADMHSFELLCAYVMGNFYKEGDSERFMEVCRRHSHVLPTERFSRIDEPNERLREISLLQQRARMLETETGSEDAAEVLSAIAEARGDVEGPAKDTAP